MKTHRSKIDGWIVGVMVGSAALPVLLSVTLGGPLWIALAIALPLAAFFAWLYLATTYRVRDGCLVIGAGLYTLNIPLDAIDSVTPSRDPISSPAFSLDRLKISYPGTKTVLVSPRDQAGFLDSIGWAGV